MVLLLGYLIMDNFRELHEDSPLWTMANNGGRWWMPSCTSCCCLNLSLKASGGRRRLFTSELSEIHRSLVRYYPYEELPQNVLRFILPHAHLADSLTSTCLWGIAAYVLHDNFQIDPMLTGVIFSGAAFFRILATAAMFSEPVHRTISHLLPNPRALNVALAGVAVSTLTMAVPSAPVFIAGFMAYNVFGGVLSVLLLEMQGSSTNTWESLTTQCARRLLTAACLFALPNLYELRPLLPLLLAFWVAFVSGIVVMVRICRYAGIGGQTMRRHRSSVMSARSGSAGGGSNKPEQNLVYVEQIMLGWLIKGKDL